MDLHFKYTENMRRFFDRGRILRTRLFDVSRYSGYNGRQDGLPINCPRLVYGLDQ